MSDVSFEVVGARMVWMNVQQAQQLLHVMHGGSFQAVCCSYDVLSPFMWLQFHYLRIVKVYLIFLVKISYLLITHCKDLSSTHCEYLALIV